MSFDENLRRIIIALLEQNGLDIRGNKKYFLRDFNGDTVDFRNSKSTITVLHDENFIIEIAEGKVFLGTSYSNQTIDDAWLKKLEVMKKIKDIINWEMNEIL